MDYGLYSRSWIQSDKQGSANNEYGNQIVGLFTSYKYNNLLRVTPYTGYQQSKNRNIVDWGWDVGIKGQVNNYNVGEYRTSAKIESNYDFYDKRQNFDNSFDIGTYTQFNQYTSDSLSFSYSEVSKQYYGGVSKESNLVKVKIFNRDIQNRLYYNLSANNLFSLLTKIQSRSLDFVTDRDIFFIENQFRFLHFGPKSNYGISLRTNDETQDNSGTITDTRIRQTALNFQLGYKLSYDKDLDFDFSYVKLQHDTPDEDNKDDRDEQRFIINLSYLHKLSSLLYMRWSAYVYLFHQIYINPEQSQNNKWNRIYQIGPSVHYKYKRIRNVLSTEVRANYTDYDFEEIIYTNTEFCPSQLFTCRFPYLPFFRRKLFGNFWTPGIG